LRSSSMAMSASRLGPSPAICDGSIRMALASCSSVSSRVDPKRSMCSNAADARPGAGADGGGKFCGSYFWYACTMPPGLRGLGAMEHCSR